VVEELEEMGGGGDVGGCGGGVWVEEMVDFEGDEGEEEGGDGGDP